MVGEKLAPIAEGLNEEHVSWMLPSTSADYNSIHWWGIANKTAIGGRDQRIKWRNSHLKEFITSNDVVK